jgi:hypothetical protein
MTDRKAIAAAFRAAKSLLWDGAPSFYADKFTFICNALVDSRHEARHAASDVIRIRLSPFNFLNQWLKHKGIDAEDYPPERLQAHRHAWLDMLIAEFEGEEK